MYWTGFHATVLGNSLNRKRSPKVDVVDVPLPEADGGISSSGQHVTLGALGKRWKLKTHISHRKYTTYTKYTNNLEERTEG